MSLLWSNRSGSTMGIRPLLLKSQWGRQSPDRGWRGIDRRKNWKGAYRRGKRIVFDFRYYVLGHVSGYEVEAERSLCG
jgi:hypothetical protein